MDDILKNLKLKLENTVNHFKSDIQSIRSGKVSPQLVENIIVVFNEQKFSVKQLASVSILPPNTILISPWDKIYLDSISKAIEGSALGYAPASEGNVIKLTIPGLTEEKRLEMVKLLKNKAEASRVSVRKEREEALKSLKEIEKTISEDLKFKTKEKIQKEVNEHNKKIEEAVEKKEEEIMRV